MEIVPAHPITSLTFIGSSFLVPLLVFGTYRSSGASTQKSLGIAAAVTLWGIIMFFFMRYWQFSFESPLAIWGIVIINLIWPSVLVIVFREFFVGDGLSLKWLALIQATRFMGGLFILENIRGFTGTTFAYTGGFGDVIAAVIALTILLQLLTGGHPNKFIYYFLIAFGVADFFLAYTLSFLSSDGIPLQSLALDEAHLMNLYPLALIPHFLVPFAMAYHWLMYFTVKRAATRPA
ncbi:MAG: hypothetical protein AAF629_30395 [Chloroflexota bacterium]